MQQTFEDIKKNHPDEWLILGDPVMSDDGQKILSGVLLYHSPDKRTLAFMDKPLMKTYKTHAYIFNKVTARPRSVMVGIHTVKRTLFPGKHEPIKSIYAQ